MKERIKAIIDAKAHGKQIEFAHLMGWSQQYVHRLIKDGSVGLSPIVAIAEKFDDINMRWLLTGEGNMLTNNAVDVISRLLNLEPLFCVMTEAEIASIAKGNDVSEADILRWQTLLDERTKTIDNIFLSAYRNQAAL